MFKGAFYALFLAGKVTLFLISGLLRAAEACEEGERAGSPHLDVLTTLDDSTIRTNTVVIRFRGPIIAPMSGDLKDILASIDPKFETILFHLNSLGGSLSELNAAIAVLAPYRQVFTIKTFVDHGEICASSCIALFMQGEERIAHGASSWLFHGACGLMSNVPIPSATGEYVEIVKSAGASAEFLDILEKNYIRFPGEYWLSGYELYHAKANIITKLLQPWEPKNPVFPPFDPQLKLR